MKTAQQLIIKPYLLMLLKSLFVSAVLVMLASSCEETFFKEEESLKVIDNEQEVQELMAGIYNRLLSVHDRSYFAKFQRSDDISQSPGRSTIRGGNGDIESCSFTPGTHPHLDDLYSKLYKTIVTTNRLISDLKEEPYDPYLGEAYIIRAYCYYDLVRLFGKVPLVLDTDVKYDLQLSEIALVYQSIVADLRSAVAILPESPESSSRKISTGTAKALLAEVYLTMAGYPLNDTEKYALAAEMAGEVIAQADVHKFSLMDDYSHLWRNSTDNAETVFGMNLPVETDDDPFIEEEENIIYNHLWANVRGTRGQLAFRQHFSPELTYYDQFPDDHRKQTSFTGGYYTSRTTTILNQPYTWVDFTKIDPMDYVLPECYHREYIFYTKFTATTREDEESGFNVHMNKLQNIPLLRYAHTLLTYAEAKARSGALDASAYDAVNMVRRRANRMDIFSSSAVDMQGGLSADVFADSVVMERSWEFCLEPQGRWFDIVRLDMAEQVSQSRHQKEITANNLAEIFPDGGYYARIPQEDIWLNPNLSDDAND